MVCRGNTWLLQTIPRVLEVNTGSCSPSAACRVSSGNAAKRTLPAAVAAAGTLIRGHAEIRRKFIHLGCRLLFCKAFLQKWPHQSRGLVKVLDAVERDAIKPAEKRFG